ncbi:inactive protein RESTRICTED TEV MOVEMENT 2-like [Hibiscus syriacus]|uniref:inactive protein RESTRICTED TEV MOVEMENT 2-like n=1 Tax=Hibiscus syriacus TaxID=106335 RepID=UPI001923FDFA|nr:inactive protein RESTRICTED TEV MOVEMENT 2-like [Hibiscus syriacus]
MDSKLQPIYEDFEVHAEWLHEAADDTLIAYLPGFRKEQLTVQVTSRGDLRLSGKRPVGDNKFSRFTKEVPVPSNCDQNKIRANYKDGILYIKIPKLIAPVDGKPENSKPSAENPIPDSDLRAAEVPEKQNNSLEQGVQKSPPKAKEADKVPEQTPRKQKEIEDNSKSKASNEPDHPGLMEKDINGSDQEENSSSISEKPADSGRYALKKTDIYWQLGIHHERVIGGLAKGMKNPRKVMNMVLAVLLIAALAVYVRNAVMSTRNY